MLPDISRMYSKSPPVFCEACYTFYSLILYIVEAEKEQIYAFRVVLPQRFKQAAITHNAGVGGRTGIQLDITR